MPSIQSVQKMHNAYRDAMDARSSHHEGAFRRAEASSKLAKKENATQVASSFKEILSAKMNKK